MRLSAVLLPALASLSLAETVNLYAYGDGIGGFPLHYADGNAVISQSPPKNATVVAFTKDPSTNDLIGNPNVTSTSPPFTNELLFIPGPSSTSKQIGFTNDTSEPEEQVTDRFVWYGNFLLVENDDGAFTSLFSVRSSEGVDSGEYSLFWNDTDSAGTGGEDGDVITVSMRSVAPSSE